MVICAETDLTPLLNRLVIMAALLKRYSPSPHSLLRLLDYVPALPSSFQL